MRGLLMLVTVFFLSWASSGAAAEILSPERAADWTPGVTVGVPGGIPTHRTRLIDVTKAPYQADNTGAADTQSAIMQAIAAAKDDDVVYLPTGRYRLDKSIYFGTKSRITLRGDGPGKTVLELHAPCIGGINIGAGGGDWWYADRLKLKVTGSPTRGATVLTVGDTKPLNAYPKGGIGQLCQVSLKNDPKLPVIAPAHWEFLRKQQSRIVQRTPTTVTISPGLLFDLPESLEPRFAPAGRTAELVGVEDLAVDGAHAQAQTGLRLGAGHACWVKNVTIRNIKNYHLSISDSVQCEVRHCHMAKRQGAGSNGAAVLVGTCSFCLFEDNMLVEQFPHFEVNVSTGNVFGYNFCYDSSIRGLLGCSINSNHGAHCSFNLYEGNYSPRFQSDGYHGGASHDTALRNWFHGTDDKVKQYWICVNLNRFTRYYSLLGNVLGRKGHDWLYEVEDVGFSYDKHFLYSFGFPNMGNGWSNGKNVAPSQGQYWADWEKMLASPLGKGPGPGGFQERDLDVRATTLVKGNYNYKDRGVPESESLGGAELPKSLYLKSKPAWFGELAWPPFGPDVDFENNKIPAQVRFEAMQKAGGRAGQ